MKLKRILFATDFSPPSQSALRYATALARDSGATLLIVHVEVASLELVGDMIYLPPASFPNPELRRILDGVVPSDETVRYEHRLLTGEPAEEILRLADEADIDLIVMGTHGRTGLSRMLMGSVAESVLRKAPCPVLTLKQADRVLAGVA